MLFYIALEEILKKVLNINIRVRFQVSMTINKYVDIVLLLETEMVLQSVAEALIDESKQMGLLIYNEKTKYFNILKSNKHTNFIV